MAKTMATNDDLKYYAYNRWSTCQTKYVMESSGCLSFFNNETDKISYHYDEWGFRSSIIDGGQYYNIDLENSRDLAFGCSNTFGYELEHELTWAHMMNLSNLSVVGGSIQTIARLAEAWIPILRPNKIYVQEPTLDRRELLYTAGESYLNFLTIHLLYACPVLFPEYEQNFMTQGAGQAKSIQAFAEKFPDYDILNNKANKKVSDEAKARIEKVCNDNNVRLIFMPLNEQPKIVGKARDMRHPDDKWNLEMMKKFKELESNI